MPFPSGWKRRLRAKGHDVRLINAGVSGDTTAGGRARLEWALGDKPDIAIVELGANDALRGIDPQETYNNLDAILNTLTTRHIPILLAGMKAPRNLGNDFIRVFDDIYPKLQKKYGVLLYPFFLDGVALHSDRLQPDGLHPTAEGVGVIVAGILPVIETMLPAAGNSARKQ